MSVFFCHQKGHVLLKTPKIRICYQLLGITESATKIFPGEKLAKNIGVTNRLYTKTLPQC